MHPRSVAILAASSVLALALVLAAQTAGTLSYIEANSVEFAVGQNKNQGRVLAANTLWRTSFFVPGPSEEGPISRDFYRNYTHVNLIGLQCSGGRLVDSGYGNQSTWGQVRSETSAVGVKLQIYIGNWDMGTCTTSSNITTYVNDIVSVVNGTHPTLNPQGAVFDGVALDWEESLDTGTDAANYAELMRRLRQALPNKIITMDASAIGGMREAARLGHSYLDQINMMCYDTRGADGYSWYDSVIDNKNVNSVSCKTWMDRFISDGVPASKLGYGIPFYGYAYTGCTQALVSGCNSSSQQHKYRDIITNNHPDHPQWWNNGANKRWDSDKGAEYLSVAATNQFITYADTRYVQESVAWAAARGLGGMMVWHMGMDYNQSASGSARFPLSTALYNATAGAAGSDTQAPTTPTNLSASTVSSSQINLSWSASTDNVGVTGYNIYRCTGSACTPSFLTTVTGTTFSNTGLSSNTTYNYRVSAVDAAGNSSGQSNQVSATTQTVQQTPVVQWKFDETSGSTAADSSGSGYHANLSGAPTWLSGSNCKIGGCLSFNGINQSGSRSSLNLSDTNVVTLAFWMNSSSFNNSDGLTMEFSQNFNNSQTGFMVDPNSSTGMFEVGLNGDGGYNQITFNRPSAGWHHYAFVLNKGNIAVTEVIPYVDGVAVSYTKPTASENNNSFGNDTLNIMSRGGSTLFNAGSLDEVRIYKRVLSASEISSLATVQTGDTALPSVSVSSPIAGAVVSGTVTITATASDNVGVAGVQFKVDGVNVGSEDTTSPYSVSWNTLSVNDGLRSIIAVARDTATNQSTSLPIVVTVNNTPSVSCGAPASNAFTACYYSGTAFNTLVKTRTDSYPLNFDWGVTSPDVLVPVDLFSAKWEGSFQFEAGDYTFTTTADDGVRVYVDGQLVIDKWFDQGPTTYNAVRNMTAGSHVVKMEFYENLGGAVAKLSWQKNATGDTVAPTAPTNLVASSTSSSQINLSWSASTDNVGISGYRVLRSGVQIATTTVTSFSNTGLSAGTSYTYTVLAFDAANNLSQQSNQATAVTQSQETITTVYLSDLVPTYSVNGWGPVEKDMSNGESLAGDGGPLNLGGTVYPKGLGVHAVSDVRYSIGNCTTFSAVVGIDEEVGGNSATAAFQVFADGAKLFDSGVMTPFSPDQNVSVSISGKTTLQLVVTDGGDNEYYDHGDWADAKMLCSTTTPPPPPVDNVMPMITISNPGNGQTLKGNNLTISASATDNVGVTKMELVIDGTLRTSTNSASLSYNWNIKGLSKGTHTITINAYDAAGNKGVMTISVRR